MKRSEVLTKFADKIMDDMVDNYRVVLESDGGIQYKMYIWDDGELQRLEQVQGDNTYLVPNRLETCELHYITTIDAPCFCAWDFTNEPCPENDDEREAAEKEIIDWLVSEYRNNVWDTLQAIIKDAEFEEKYSSY